MVQMGGQEPLRVPERPCAVSGLQIIRATLPIFVILPGRHLWPQGRPRSPLRLWLQPGGAPRRTGGCGGGGGQRAMIAKGGGAPRGRR